MFVLVRHDGSLTVPAMLSPRNAIGWALAGVVAVSPVMAGEVSESHGIRVVAESGSDIRIQDGNGATVLTLGGLQVKGVPGGSTRNGRVSRAAAGAIEVAAPSASDSARKRPTIGGRTAPGPSD